ncbi:DUF4221 domain-containing protein [Phocaeicola sp.]
MKYTFNILFTFLLFFEVSCTLSSHAIDESTTLVTRDSISFPIDELTYYGSKSIFQFEEKGQEYLSFLDTEHSQKIHIYDINNQELIKTIPLQKEGPNGMTALSGCHPLDLNHFIITSWNGIFWLVNDKGEIEKSYNFWENGTNFQSFDHISFSSYNYKPAIIKDSILYFSQSLLKYPRKKNDWNKIPMFAFANLSTGNIGWTELRYPLIFEEDEDFKNAQLYDPEICYTYTGENVVISLGQYDSIMVSPDFKHKSSYNAKSRYLAHAYPHLQDGQIDLFKNIQIQGKLPHYSHLMYDKYREVFYRFALMPDDNIKPFSSNPHQSFSIIILNKDYEIIGETKFPGNNYTYQLCFVGKKGLYISENNENNPRFDENKLVFRCFTLQDKNE